MIEAEERHDTHQAPFPYFGGKRTVADLVWQRFGDTKNYVEPFFGSGAMLLARTPWGGTRLETVNDINGFLANVWRAVQADPEAVAHYADWPVNETDLHARHNWLMHMAHPELEEQMRLDPDYYDAQVAGWWVWGARCWIGGGWCDEKAITKQGIMCERRPHLGMAGQCVNRMIEGRPYLVALSERLRRVRVCCGDWSRICGPTPTVKQGLTAVFLDPPYSAEAGRYNEIYASEDLMVAHDVREWAITQGNDPLMRIALCGYEGEHEMPDTWECVAWKSHGGYAASGKKTDRGKQNRVRERIWFSPHCLQPVQARLF